MATQVLSLGDILAREALILRRIRQIFQALRHITAEKLQAMRFSAYSTLPDTGSLVNRLAGLLRCGGLCMTLLLSCESL
jgi:hypothetical protein